MRFRMLRFAMILSASVFMSYLPSSGKNNHPGTGQLQFVTNRGQVHDQHDEPRQDIDFRLKADNGLSVFIGSGAIHYQWSQPQTSGSSKSENAPLQMYRMDVQLLGANLHAPAITERPTDYYEQYYTDVGNFQAQAFQKITYKNIYPNIDWVLYIKNNTLEYDFIIHPGGEVSDIHMQFSGAQRLQLNSDGSLAAITPAGIITEQAPHSFDERGKTVASRYTLQGDIVRFQTAPYKGTLTIDPAVDWGTYLGDALNDAVASTACDDSGNVYVAGSTASTANIATSGAHQVTYGGGTGSSSYYGDAYLAKFSSTGACQWITYYGGSAADQGWSVAIDTGNHVYLAGFTSSTNGIATTGSHQATIGGGSDAFLAKFSSNGQRQWATYYGGTGNENLWASVSCDTLGNVFLAGITNGNNGIATSGAHQSAIGGGTDGFLVKFDGAGARQWATYYGGTAADNIFQAACDPTGNVYITGYTQSATGIATTGSYQSTSGGGDEAYLAKFNTYGQSLWSTYCGSSGTDRGFSVATGDSGYVYLAGSTNSTSGMATTGVHQSSFGGGSQDIFLMKFDSTGTRQWGTYFGGNNEDVIAPSLSVSVSGDVYLGGNTKSASGIATAGAYQTTLNGTVDGFITRFTSGGQQVWGSYFGGADLETGYMTAADKTGNVYLGGQTNSSAGVATTGGYQTTLGGGYRDGFLVKINDCDTPAQPGVITGPVSVCKGESVTYSITPVALAISYLWTLPPGWTGTATGTSITVTAGSSNGLIKVTANTPCAASAPQTLNVTISLVAAITPAGTHSFCDEDSMVLQANSGSGLSWQWIKDGSPVSGVTDASYTVYQSGLYTVAISDGQCTDTALSDTITVHPLPVPVITQSGADLETGAFIGYQWLYNGQSITGATGPSYTPPADGAYHVIVTDTNGCSDTSASFVITDVPATASTMSTVRLYPNPAGRFLYVASPVAVHLTITTIEGKTVLSSQGAVTDISTLADGLYLVRVSDRDGKVITTEKLLKISSQ